MPRYVDEDVIRNKPVSREYRDNWARVFGDPEPERLVEIKHFCKECDALVPDPENHRHAPTLAPVYYAHPIWTYGTEQERADAEAILNLLGGVLDPNTPEHDAAYKARKADTGNGMDYFLEDVLPKCRGCAFRADIDGKVSSGVAMEVQWFLERGKPVWEIVGTRFVPCSILVPERLLTREESISRCQPRCTCPHQDADEPSHDLDCPVYRTRRG